MRPAIALISEYWCQISFLLLALITVLSLTPLPDLPQAPGSDKVHHLIAYSALALPAALRGRRNWFLLMPVFVLWSGAIELIQPFVNRHAEVLDLAANTVGLCLGAFLGVVLRRNNNS